MKLFVAGSSFKSASVEVRERLAVAPSRLGCAGCRLKVFGELAEVVLLSTCNRVEIYGVASGPNRHVEALLGSLSSGGGDVVSPAYVHEGANAVRHLAKKGARAVLVSNRSLERAQALATEFGGRAVRFDECLGAMVEADIAVSSTGSPETILNRAQIETVMRERRGRPLCSRSVPALFDRHRGATRHRPGRARARKRLPLRHRRLGRSHA